MKEANNWLTQRLFQFVLIALACGYFLPITPSSGLKLLVIVLFSFMTFITSLSTSFRDFLVVARNPKMPLYILCIVHIAVPAVAWIMGLVFFPEHPLIRTGYLISAAVPVGVTSIIWTAIVRGNMPVSLVTVTIDVIIAPALLPLFILLTAGVFIQIDYVAMIIDLLCMVTLPSIAGMLLCDYSGGKSRLFAESAGGVLSRIAFFIIIFLNAAFVSSSITMDLLFLQVLVVTGIFVAVGYSVGYAAGKIIRAEHATTLSIIYNTGMRNIVTGLVIAISYFPPETAVPLALTMLFQQPFAALAAKVYQWKFPGYDEHVDEVYQCDKS
jgi:predicted Na+-dependent transporter